MHFPRFRDDHPYVLIVRGDGFPCGARSWCQIACGFANHMQKAPTLLYNWTLDLALGSEHETDLVRVLFGETLKEIQQIIDRGYMVLRGFWVRTVVMIGGDTPWLRHILVVHGVGDHPMLVHTHPKDDSPLTGEIALGDFVGGGLFTSALLCANGPSRPAWIRWGRDLLWGHIVDPRYGVMFNALRPHMPLAWSGQRIVLVPYTELHGDVCLWRCRMYWSRLASQGEDVFFV